MMKNKKRFIAIILSVLMLFDVSMIATATMVDEEMILINTYVEYLDSENIEGIENLLCEEEREDFVHFISNEENKQNHIGYFNYKSAELISIMECTEMISSLDYELSDYSNITSMRAWECIINVETYRDTKYLIDGNNKFIIVLGYKIDGTPTIVGFVRDRVWSETNGCEEYNSSDVELYSYDAPISAPSLGVWTTPSTIVVKNYGAINFKTYCKVVTVNEWGNDSYNSEAIKAVALAVKNYGWNRTLVQKYPNEEYDVNYTTADQAYDPNKTVTTKVSNAVDAIWNYVMLSCDYKLFCGFHVHSSAYNSYARNHGGVLSQEGSESLADSGYTWQEILHYFYDYGTFNSEMTAGVIKIVNLTHTLSGSTYSSNINYHWIVCTTCGCAHSRNSHSWVLMQNTDVLCVGLQQQIFQKFQA